jgi:hypothetical protein
VANDLQKIVGNIKKAIVSDRPMRTALTTVLAIHKPRIFEKGLDRNKTKVGTYSTKPASISKKSQARDTGQTSFKGGYSEYKSAIGKNPGYVNFRNTDQMMMDYQLVKSGNTWGFGFQNQTNFNKSQWLQEKYDKDSFDMSDEELNLFADVLKLEIEKML